METCNIPPAEPLAISSMKISQAKVMQATTYEPVSRFQQKQNVFKLHILLCLCLQCPLNDDTGPTESFLLEVYWFPILQMATVSNTANGDIDISSFHR